MQQWPRDVVRLNLTKRLPYEDRSVTAIYSSHTLEHLYFADAVSVLHECARVLEPSGILRVALPDASALARELLAGDASDEHARAVEFNQRLNAHPFDRPRGLRRLSSLLGSSSHRWQPTPGLVTHMLEGAGFHEIRRHTFREGCCPDLLVLETRPESFFLEAKAS